MGYRVTEHATVNLENTEDTFKFLGYDFDLSDFQAFTSWTGTEKLGEQAKELGYGDGYTPRGGGNSDTAFYAVNLSDYHSEDVIHIALIEHSDD